MANSSEKNTWFPTPRYLCRKAVVFSFLDEIGKGTFLEVGIGAGDLILELARKSYKGVGIDISSEAVRITQEKLKNLDCDIMIKNKNLFEVTEKFDIIFALELIEHFDNDEKPLRKINELINKSGYLILSVPAHKKEWDINDEWAGHYRRYEKKEIKSKLEKAGFEVLKLYNYGFPITSIAKPIRNYFKSKDGLSQDKVVNTKRSGTDRASEKRFSFLVNGITMSPFLLLQKFFFDKDWGDGYIALAKK